MLANNAQTVCLQFGITFPRQIQADVYTVLSHIEFCVKVGFKVMEFDLRFLARIVCIRVRLGGTKKVYKKT